MLSDLPSAAVVLIFLALSLVALIRRVAGFSSRVDAYIHYLWTFFLIFTVSEVVSFNAAIWILAGLCFIALREYFTLTDIRLQDRWGILGAYLSIPFMIVFIQIDWYGMFIISIPVYAFLVIPFLVTLGGKEAEGTVSSIGAIDFGLFMLVYCIGHIGYLGLFSTWMAIMLLLNVAMCDLVAYLIGTSGKLRRGGDVTKYLASTPVTVILMLIMSGWTGIPRDHSVALGLAIPALVGIGRHTISYIESDLGIATDRLVPGKGRVFDSITSFLYAAPVVFHYIRYFLK